MTLTSEQLSVVNLVSGRHLVLAPPGSGKTEMLSQRIIRALASGSDPKKMLCATFTNRAAFEMRDRVSSAAGPDCSLPDVGNLHHFCHRFLLSVRRLHPGKHVLDESQQLDFIREVTDVLREELREGRTADLKKTHGVSVMPTIKGICEPMRLLYVAMSRAKRHLALMDCGPGGVCLNLTECFRADYTGYYLRRAQGDDLSCDWLHQWEELAKANGEGQCPMKLVEPALTSKTGAVVRMALKTLRHHLDSNEARRRWLDCIESDFAETAIGCLRVARVYDSEVIDRVRKASLASAKLRDHRAALQYFEAGLACAREHRARLLAAIGDFVYHCNGTLRLDATTFLVDQGVMCWKGAIRGASTDFIRLQSVADDAHEETIRSILARKLPDDYERRLRAILFAHARRKV